MRKPKKPTTTTAPKATKPRPFAKVVRVKDTSSLFSIMAGEIVLGNLGPMQVAKGRARSINAAVESWHAERCAACDRQPAMDFKAEMRKLLDTLPPAERAIVAARHGIKPDGNSKQDWEAILPPAGEPIPTIGEWMRGSKRLTKMIVQKCSKTGDDASGPGELDEHKTGKSMTVGTWRKMLDANRREVQAKRPAKKRARKTRP